MESKVVIELVYNVMHLLRKNSNVALDIQNLYVGQSKCLYQISQAGEISQKKLAEALNIRANSLSEMIAKLELKGLVKRKQSKQDKRTYLVSLTESGEKEVERIRMARADSNVNCLECLTEEEREQFYYILNKIQAYYQKD